MRDPPGGIDAVAREATGELVVDAAARDRAQRRQRDLALAAGEQELDDRGLGELGRAAEASVARIELPGELRHGAVECLLRRGLRAGLQQRASRESPAQQLAAAQQLVAALAPGLGDRREHLAPGRHSWPRLGREIGAAVDR